VNLNATSADVRGALERALEGRELSVDDAAPLTAATGDDLGALCGVADELRARHVGEGATYVVNRNINFTNVCVKSCRFCAFSRGLRSEEGYFLDTEEVVRRALQARAYGATEVCLQAGLVPRSRGRMYADLLRAIRAAAPKLHLHAFSPEEVRYGATLRKLSVHEFLCELKEAGLGSLPGTSAEVLDDRIRERISPGRLTTSDWLEVIRSAHALDIPTTCTLMFGHVESPLDRLRHLALLRSIQRETGGFTEFVPLSFVHTDAPLFARDAAVSAGPGEDDVVRLYAIARLMLGPTIRNIQASWVKEGLALARRLLRCGANDLGGTLINESISTTAGARHGQLVTPRTLRALIRDVGRVPTQRRTDYEPVRVFDDPAADPPEPLDEVTDPSALFGSYATLVEEARFRYRLP